MLYVGDILQKSSSASHKILHINAPLEVGGVTDRCRVAKANFSGITRDSNWYELVPGHEKDR